MFIYILTTNYNIMMMNMHEHRNYTCVRRGLESPILVRSACHRWDYASFFPLKAISLCLDWAPLFGYERSSGNVPAPGLYAPSLQGRFRRVYVMPRDCRWSSFAGRHVSAFLSTALCKKSWLRMRSSGLPKRWTANLRRCFISMV